MSRSHAVPLPCPFELLVGSMVLQHRAALLTHDQATHDALVEASDDYLEYGQFLVRLTGQALPWDPQSDNTPTPTAVFFEAADWVGYTQRTPAPSLGVDRRHFRLLPRNQADEGKFAPTPRMAGAVAVMELVQHPDKRWQVLHVEVSKEHRRRSLARVLYDRVQSVLETTLYPSGWLSEDAYHFWQDRGCFFLQWYQQVDDFKGMWLSPKALLTLRDLAAAQMMDWSEDAKAS